jgi:hypothetical protein
MVNFYTKNSTLKASKNFGAKAPKLMLSKFTHNNNSLIILFICFLMLAFYKFFLQILLIIKEWSSMKLSFTHSE